MLHLAIHDVRRVSKNLLLNVLVQYGGSRHNTLGLRAVASHLFLLLSILSVVLLKLMTVEHYDVIQWSPKSPLRRLCCGLLCLYGFGGL
jgi:hypothetical protein